MTKRAPVFVVNALERARELATMERFGAPDETIISRGKVVSATDYIRDRTAPYRESWLIPEIDKVLDWATGKTGAVDKNREPGRKRKT